MALKRITLIGTLARLIWKRKVWFLIPIISLLLFAIFILMVVESPALIPFFYAIF